MESVIAKNQSEKEFHQAVQEVVESLMPTFSYNLTRLLKIEAGPMPLIEV